MPVIFVKVPVEHHNPPYIQLGFCIANEDYGFSNGQLGPGGVWIIDLDGVAFDLAIRDLRKLITSTMDDMGVWDLAWIRGMIDAYHAACPIEPELMQVLLIDMSLPNEFYKHVKAGVTNIEGQRSTPDRIRSRVLALCVQGRRRLPRG